MTDRADGPATAGPDPAGGRVAVVTGASTGIHARGGRPDRLAQMAPTIPMHRAGRPEEVADAIAWLCSSQASYVTGAHLDVTGGR
ncbi:MAG TPA: SDR family oxidoreductase [Acidimicrobiales bacterium]